MKTETKKEAVLSEILQLESKIASLSVDLGNITAQYVADYSPIKKGEIVTILYFDGEVRHPLAKVIEVYFDTHSPFWSFKVQPITKNGRPKENVYPFNIALDQIKR